MSWKSVAGAWAQNAPEEAAKFVSTLPAGQAQESAAQSVLSAWATGASPVHLILLAIGGLATLILVLRLGQVAIKLGLVSRVPIDPGPTISGQIDLK